MIIKLVISPIWLVLLTKAAGKKPLYVGALFELSEHWYRKYTPFFITIMEHAFAEIDNRTDLLTDYSLQLIPKDTEVML